MDDWYPRYTYVGACALTAFLEFAIERRKGLSKDQRKRLFTRLRRYDILTYKGPYEERRKGLNKLAKLLGGQKLFEAYERRREHGKA